MRSERFAMGVWPAGVPSMTTSAQGTALMLTRPSGTGTVRLAIPPGRTVTVWRDRYPRVSLTRSTVCGPSFTAIGPALDPSRLLFSKTCSSIGHDTLMPPKREAAGPAARSGAGPSDFAGASAGFWAAAGVGAGSGVVVGAGMVITAAGCVGISSARAGGGGVTTTADGRLNSPAMTMPSPTATTASPAATQRAILNARPECHSVGGVDGAVGSEGSSMSTGARIGFDGVVFVVAAGTGTASGAEAATGTG